MPAIIPAARPPRTGRTLPWLIAVAVLCVLLPGVVLAQDEIPYYGLLSYWEWRISSSSTDAEVQTGTPFVGETDLYLWLTCSLEAATTARMDLAGSLELVSFTPEAGVTVNAPLPQLDLDIGCRGGPWILVGTLRVRDATGAGGDVCMGPDRYTTWCDVGRADDHAFVGFTTLGTPPCWDSYCGVDYVDPLSWGRVKAYFESTR